MGMNVDVLRIESTSVSTSRNYDGGPWFATLRLRTSPNTSATLFFDADQADLVREAIQDLESILEFLEDRTQVHPWCEVCNNPAVDGLRVCRDHVDSFEDQQV